MATFKDLFSTQQINAIKAVATSESNADKYAPSLLDFQRDDLYKFAAEHNVELSVGFWKQMETLAHTCENAIVCIKGKHAIVEHMERSEILPGHLGIMLKQGVAMFFVNISRVITWDNWKAIYACLIPVNAKAKSNYDIERVMTSIIESESQDARNVSSMTLLDLFVARKPVDVVLHSRKRELKGLNLRNLCLNIELKREQEKY